MTYSIIGAGTVGTTLARLFAAKGVPVQIANSRGPNTLKDIVAELGSSVTAVTVEDAVGADIVLFAIGSLAFKEIGALRHDWSGTIVIDVTNGFMLPAEVQEAEFHGRLTSEVNAERVPGGKLVKALNQLPFRTLAAPVPAGGQRVVFVSSDDDDASNTVAKLVEQLGFAAIEVGKLAEGGRLIQARAPLVFQNLIKFPM